MFLDNSNPKKTKTLVFEGRILANTYSTHILIFKTSIGIYIPNESR
jgi:hypothetical protein